MIDDDLADTLMLERLHADVSRSFRALAAAAGCHWVGDTLTGGEVGRPLKDLAAERVGPERAHQLAQNFASASEALRRERMRIRAKDLARQLRSQRPS